MLLDGEGESSGGGSLALERGVSDFPFGFVLGMRTQKTRCGTSSHRRRLKHYASAFEGHYPWLAKHARFPRLHPLPDETLGHNSFGACFRCKLAFKRPFQ